MRSSWWGLRHPAQKRPDRGRGLGKSRATHPTRHRNVVQALQGRVAGVDVTAQSGKPGAGMRIRGVGTINNSDPLYVVDGFQTGDIGFLAPTDIESMEILKDASATAIYGSRGANGVVLITTKRGKAGEPKFSLQTYVASQQAWRHLSLLNATQYATLTLEAYDNDGAVIDKEVSTIAGFVKAGNYRGTDWQKELLQSAPMQQYSLNMMGGTETNRYSLTGTYIDQEGIVLNSGLKKAFVRFNGDLKISNWLKGGFSLSYVNSRSTFFDAGSLQSAIAVDPVTPAIDPVTGTWARSYFPDNQNPAQLVDEVKNNVNRNNLINANAYLDAEVLKGLTLRTQFGSNLSFGNTKSYYPKFFISTKENREQSNLNESRGQGTSWMWTNTATYQRDFGKHSVTGLLGYEIQNGASSNISISAYNVPVDTDLWYVSSAQGTGINAARVNSSQGSGSLMSYFGRVNYGFDRRYLLTATLRYDGSSKFLPASRWGVFPSFAGSWNISEEAFMKALPVVNQLKLRAGWGQVGNQNAAGDYGYVTRVIGGNLYVFNGQVVEGFSPKDGSNPELQWETTTQTNVGLDAAFLSNRLSLNADFFIKKTTDMILRAPVHAGYGAPNVNAGSMENKGVELSLNYRDQVGGLRYGLGAIFTKINNRVTSLGGGAPLNGTEQRGASLTRTEVGREIATFYGLQTDGIFNTLDELTAYTKGGPAIQPNARIGDVKFMDLNGDGKITADDRTYLGSATPDFTYAFTSKLSFKSIDLNLFFQGIQGNEIISTAYQGLTNSNGIANSLTERLDRWTLDNPDTDQPRMTFRDPNQNSQFSDRFVKNGSYLRLYAAADNLLTFTNYVGFDPEIGDGQYGNTLDYGIDIGTYPQARTCRVGLNLNF
ncbi:MAG: SusC/RagA family TonB-linked outer membrane protein [Cytophagaceae bacterium]|nr:SusC/RagA family TonB-linked outer membrane protein [Cytophagaceae bacterium]